MTATLSSRFAALLGALAARLRDRPSLHELDSRTLADIGIDRSEISSIEHESRGSTPATRLRLALRQQPI